MKPKFSFTVALLAIVLSAGVVLGTAGSGAVAQDLARGRLPNLEKFGLIISMLRVSGDVDVLEQTVTVAPGGHSGWHSHPGPALVVVQSGTFTLYDGDDPTCKGTAHPAGSSFVDRGLGHVHIARNEGSTPVVVFVTYFLPPGAPARVDVPAPGNCPF